MSLVYLPQETTPVQNDALWALAWLGPRLVSGGADGIVRIHDPTDLALPLNELEALPLAISSISGSADGRFIASSLDGTVALAEDGKWVDRFDTGRESDVPAYAAALHPQAEAWAWAGRGTKVALRRISDKLAGEESSATLEKGRFGMTAKFSPDGRQLAVGMESGHVAVLDVSTSTVVASYAAHALCVRTLDWSPDSQWLYSGSDDARIVLHDVRAGGEGARGEGAVAILQGHQSWVLSTAASPDSKLLASGGADKMVKLWDVGQRACVSTSTAEAEVWGVAWQGEYEGALPAGKQFAIAGDDKKVSLYRAAGAV
ncbi:WD40 repeat-like protein [Cutaneotrichosporon oleaginosum]|uniref:WD40 repeat-like protein n=1 Tax=Cutaneotrichosporon oleaginosum TaxID=879819 RepID=A0A0J0XKL7_9TREE|nr:WD40 repeat-like protein [Cutaneotrichosporon oleaginosum]KLT41653.1 WD40 repeat-like protein [Cutaneotrichosporon oleaginosum]